MISDDLLNSLVGMTEQSAREKIESLIPSKLEFQVTRRDSETFMSDMMFNTNRVKVELEHGLVVKAMAG